MTVAELAVRLRLEGIPERVYSLDGSSLGHEGLILTNVQGIWLIEHFERGTRRTLASYLHDEDAACTGMLELVKRDYSPVRD